MRRRRWTKGQRIQSDAEFIISMMMSTWSAHVCYKTSSQKNKNTTTRLILVQCIRLHEFRSLTTNGCQVGEVGTSVCVCARFGHFGKLKKHTQPFGHTINYYAIDDCDFRSSRTMRENVSMWALWQRTTMPMPPRPASNAVPFHSMSGKCGCVFVVEHVRSNIIRLVNFILDYCYGNMAL